MIPPVPSSPTRFLTTEPTHTLTQGVPPAGRQDTPPKAMENYPPLPAEAPAQLPPSSKLQVPLTPFTESNASPMATQTTALDSDPPTLAFGDVAPSGTSANEGDAPPVFPHGAIEDSSLCGEILPCPRCTTKAILVKCETCSDSYCSECIRTEIDIGLVWCIPCKEDTTTTKQSKRQEPPSTSNSDTSSDRSSSDDSVYTQQSTHRSGQRRKKKRPLSRTPTDTRTLTPPKYESLPTVTTDTGTTSEPQKLTLKPKVQTTLDIHGRPRRALAKYSK